MEALQERQVLDRRGLSRVQPSLRSYGEIRPRRAKSWQSRVDPDRDRKRNTRLWTLPESLLPPRPTAGRETGNRRQKGDKAQAESAVGRGPHERVHRPGGSCRTLRSNGSRRALGPGGPRRSLGSSGSRGPRGSGRSCRARRPRRQLEGCEGHVDPREVKCGGILARGEMAPWVPARGGLVRIPIGDGQSGRLAHVELAVLVQRVRGPQAPPHLEDPVPERAGCRSIRVGPHAIELVRDAIVPPVRNGRGPLVVKIARWIVPAPQVVTR